MQVTVGGETGATDGTQWQAAPGHDPWGIGKLGGWVVANSSVTIDLLD